MQRRRGTIPRRALASLALTLGVAACFQDFDTFEGTPAPGSPDAATADAAPPGTTDASRDGAAVVDATTPSDASVEAGCSSAPQTCLTQRTTCRNTCDGVYNDCRDACPNGGPGNACRQKCRTDQMTCEGTCNTTCTSCAGSCTIGCN